MRIHFLHKYYAGFIDFIVAPTMDVCGDLLDRIQMQLHQASHPVHQEVINEEAKEVTDSKARAKSLSAIRSQRNNVSLDSANEPKFIRYRLSITNLSV